MINGSKKNKYAFAVQKVCAWRIQILSAMIAYKIKFIQSYIFCYNKLLISNINLTVKNSRLLLTKTNLLSKKLEKYSSFVITPKKWIFA